MITIRKKHGGAPPPTESGPESTCETDLSQKTKNRGNSCVSFFFDLLDPRMNLKQFIATSITFAERQQRSPCGKSTGWQGSRGYRRRSGHWTGNRRAAGAGRCGRRALLSLEQDRRGRSCLCPAEDGTQGSRYSMRRRQGSRGSEIHRRRRGCSRTRGHPCEQRG